MSLSKKKIKKMLEDHVSGMGILDIIMGAEWNLVLDLNMDYCNINT